MASELHSTEPIVPALGVCSNWPNLGQGTIGPTRRSAAVAAEPEWLPVVFGLLKSSRRMVKYGPRIPARGQPRSRTNPGSVRGGVGQQDGHLATRSNHIDR